MRASAFVEFAGTDSQYQQMVACWLAERRCPIGLADHLLESGFQGPAQAAYWAATAPEREMHDGTGRSGPMPATGSTIMVDDMHERGLLLGNRWYFLGSWPILRPWHYPSRFTAQGETPEEAIRSLLGSIRVSREFDVTTDLTPRMT